MLLHVRLSTLLFVMSYEFCTSTAGLKNDTGQLVTVVVVFRHGDRVIIKPYSKDPYKNNSYWPVGWGQLTNEGKMQELELGQWLRDRYQGFLPDEYSEKDIYVRSTDVDRTLMSAEVNLAGLYPPQGKQVWDRDLSWQPIPIHTVSEKHDLILAMKRPCAMYDLLMDKLMQSPEIQEINRRNRNLYAYLAKNAGVNITDFDSVEYLYNNLVIEKLFNFTLPAWTKSVFPGSMKPLAELSFAVPCYTKEMARLKAGPFIHEMLDNLFNVTSDIKHARANRKLWMYSGHDTTIANILQALGIFEQHCPPYASTILFEVRYLNHEYFVNILYKNSSKPQAMTLQGCDFNCPLEKFVELLDPINISPDEWEEECKITLTRFLEDTNTGEVTFALGVFLVCLILIAVVTRIIYSKYRRSDSMIYLRLPDDEHV